MKTEEANTILIAFKNLEVIDLTQIILEYSEIKIIEKKDPEFTVSILFLIFYYAWYYVLYVWQESLTCSAIFEEVQVSPLRICSTICSLSNLFCTRSQRKTKN